MLTSEIINFFYSPFQNSEKSILQKLLCHLNKYKVVCIDREQAINKFKHLISNLVELCNNQTDFPQFCLTQQMYLEYTQRFQLDAAQIFKICSKHSISTVNLYKKHSKQLNLPPYEFILNGGLPNITNLSNLLENTEYQEEN